MIKNALIFGSNGQLGKEFKEDLKFNKLFNSSYYSKEECDITQDKNVEKILKKHKPCVVVNCAAYTNVDMAESQKKVANEINNIAVENLAKLSNKYNFILIHFSTDYVFNKDYGRPFLETDKKNPINFYGETKHLGEEKILKFSNKFFIFRVSWVYGKFGDNFPKKIIRLTKERSELNVVRDQIGVPTSTKFIVETISHILSNYEKSQKNFGIYNLTPNGESSWYKIALKIFDKFRNEKNCICNKINPVSSTQFKTTAFRPEYSLLCNTSLSRTFKIELSSWESSFNNFLNDIEYTNL
ncbi:MAG: dTDP-4-dehydrorhamnose reductase [Euryarchaeota archaeon]|nr:dTDP-4-dehydrorhamnose reductase [Euryarchaeota archaeon]|tara:strand:+ start:7305 stop:8198 length:894 start_codon:yes stop_codon:yes gene_type:complete